MSEKTPITKENAVEEMCNLLDLLETAANAGISFLDRVDNENEVLTSIEADEELMQRARYVFDLFERTGGLL